MISARLIAGTVVSLSATAATALVVKYGIDHYTFCHMPDSYFESLTAEANANIEIEKINAERDKYKFDEELKYKAEKDRLDREMQLQIIEEEKVMPDGYWQYKLAKECETKLASIEAKKAKADSETKKALLKTIENVVDIGTRRHFGWY